MNLSTFYGSYVRQKVISLPEYPPISNQPYPVTAFHTIRPTMYFQYFRHTRPSRFPKPGRSGYPRLVTKPYPVISIPYLQDQPGIPILPPHKTFQVFRYLRYTRPSRFLKPGRSGYTRLAALTISRCQRSISNKTDQVSRYLRYTRPSRFLKPGRSGYTRLVTLA